MFENDLTFQFHNLLCSFEFDNRDELNDADSFLSSSDDSDSDEDLADDDDDDDDDDHRQFLIAGPNHVSIDHNPETGIHGSDHESKSVGEQENAGSSRNSRDVESSEDCSRRDERKTETCRHDDFDQQCSVETRKKNRKHTAVIGRVAKTVKASTVITGKHVIKQSKHAGRVAGRVIPVSSVVYSKQPRTHEPGECHWIEMTFSRTCKTDTTSSMLSKVEEYTEDGQITVT